MPGFGPSRGTAAFVAAAALAALAVVGWLWVGDSSDRAGLIQGRATLGAITVPLLVAVVLWWWRGRSALAPSERLALAADRLADTVVAEWSREADARAITGFGVPVAVSWRAASRQDVLTVPSYGAGPPPVPTFADEAPRSPDDSILPGWPAQPLALLTQGLVTRLHDEVYRWLPRGRLVVVGPPGTGKTATLILLLLAALEHRARCRRSDPEEIRGTVPVPVLLPLGGWDPRREPVETWAADRIGEGSNGGRAGPDRERAAALLRAGHVALFLDGLDEVPADLRGLALQQLSRQTRTRIVVTSRPEEYEDARSSGHFPHAAVLELEHVTPDAAAAYLESGHEGTAQQRGWNEVADRLRSRPDSMLARAMSTPLALTLARHAYRTEDPRILLTPRFRDEKQIRGHLLDQVVASAYEDPGERRTALYWLGWIAHNMGRWGLDREFSCWSVLPWTSNGDVPGRRSAVISRLHDVMPFLFIALTGGTLGAVTVYAATREVLAVGFVLMMSLAAFLVIGLPTPLLRYTELGLALNTVVTAALHGTGVWFLAGGDTTLALTVAVILLVAMSVGPLSTPVFRFLDLRPADLATPTRRFRASMRRGRAAVAVQCLVLAAVFAWSVGSAAGRSAGMWAFAGSALWLAAVVAVAAGAGGLLQYESFWLAEAFQRVGASARPVRFLPLLDEAHRLGVLRQTGATYQFRHAELQDRLATDFERRHIGGRDVSSGILESYQEMRALLADPAPRSPHPRTLRLVLRRTDGDYDVLGDLLSGVQTGEGPAGHAAVRAAASSAVSSRPAVDSAVDLSDPGWAWTEVENGWALGDVPPTGTAGSITLLLHADASAELHYGWQVGTVTFGETGPTSAIMDGRRLQAVLHDVLSLIAHLVRAAGPGGAVEWIAGVRLDGLVEVTSQLALETDADMIRSTTVADGIMTDVLGLPSATAARESWSAAGMLLHDVRRTIGDFTPIVEPPSLTGTHTRFESSEDGILTSITTGESYQLAAYSRPRAGEDPA